MREPARIRVALTNAQREAFVPKSRMAQLARCAMKRLRIHARGAIQVTFISSRRMRALNKRFLRHDRPTDVLSFRYDQAQGNCLQPPASSLQPIVGEILIAPAQARAWAKRHGIPYTEELSRYLVHGLLHWLGEEDQTRAQQRRMRGREDDVLHRCGIRVRRIYPERSRRVTPRLALLARGKWNHPLLTFISGSI